MIFVNGMEEIIENNIDVVKTIYLYAPTGTKEVEYDDEPSYSGANSTGMKGVAYKGSLKRFDYEIPVYKTKTEFESGEVYEDELFCTTIIGSEHDANNITDFDLLQIGGYDDKSLESIYDDRNNGHLISMEFIEIDTSEFYIYRVNKQVYLMMNNTLKEFESMAELRRWLMFNETDLFPPYGEDKDLMVYHAGKDYIRSLLGIDTLSLFKHMPRGKLFEPPKFHQPRPNDNITMDNSKKINHLIKQRVKDLEREYATETARNKVAVNNIFKNMTKPDKMSGMIGRTILSGKVGEHVYDQWSKVLYTNERTFFQKSDKQYDPEVIADFKSMQPKLDEVITLVASALSIGSKKQYMLLTAGSNVGKTLIAEALGGLMVKPFRRIAKGTPIGQDQFLDYVGVLLMDDVSKANMPEIEDYKTFHNVGVVFGNSYKKITHKLDYVIMTKVDNDIMSVANIEYANRTVHIELEETPMETSKLFMDIGYIAYKDEVEKYVRWKMKKVIKKKDHKLAAKLENKYMLKTGENVFYSIIEDVIATPENYFEDVVTTSTGMKVMFDKESVLIEGLKKKLKRNDLDYGALFKELSDTHLTYKKVRHPVTKENVRAYVI